MSENKSLYFPELNFYLHERMAGKCYCEGVSQNTDYELMDLNRFGEALTRLENISQIGNTLNLNGIGKLSFSQLEKIIADINRSEFNLKTVKGEIGSEFDTVPFLNNFIDKGNTVVFKIPNPNIDDSAILDLLDKIELPSGEIPANHADEFGISQNIFLEIVLTPGIEDRLDRIFQIANNHNIYKINYSLDYTVFDGVGGFENYLEVFKNQFKPIINKMVSRSLEYEVYLHNLSSFPACVFSLEELFLINDFTNDYVGNCCPVGYVDKNFNLSYCKVLADNFCKVNIFTDKIEKKLTIISHKISDKQARMIRFCDDCGYQDNNMCDSGCKFMSITPED